MKEFINIPFILLVWSIVGIFVYQLTVLKRMSVTDAKTITIDDIKKSIPFGFFVLFSVLIAKIYMTYHPIK